MSSLSTSSLSDQSDGGVPVHSVPRTPLSFMRNGLLGSAEGNREHGVLSLGPYDSYPRPEPVPLPYGIRPPPPPVPRAFNGHIPMATFPSPGYSGNTTPHAALRPSVFESVPVFGGGVPNMAVPAPPHSHGYMAENPHQFMEGPSMATANTSTGVHPDQQTAHFHLRVAHQRIYGIMEAAHRQTNLLPQFAQQLGFDLKETSQGLARVSFAVDKLSGSLERKALECDRAQATAGMQAVEIERLRQDLDASRREIQTVWRSNEDVQKTYQEVLRSFENQIKIDQERIKAYEDRQSRAQRPFSASNSPHERTHHHQAPGMHRDNDNHGNGLVSILKGAASPARGFLSGPRPSAMLSASPLTTSGGAARNPSSFSGSGPRYSGARPKSSSGPATGTRSGHRHRGAAHVQFRPEDARPRIISNELGSPVPANASQALVLKSTSETDFAVAEWKEKFGQIFAMANGWCATYASKLKSDEGVGLQKRAPKLWEHMVEVLYPGRPESGAFHAKYLLQEQSSRAYLVQRLILDYIVQNMLNLETWTEFRKDIDAKLNSLTQKLKTIEGHRSSERQGVLDQIAGLVGSIVTHGDYPAFRQRQENFHHQRLKTLVGPLMDSMASRSDAGFDLHNIAATSMRCSAALFQSRLGFKFGWDETCSKFFTECHFARGTTADPVSLQVRQFRLKLVITPSITLRDDRRSNAVTRRVTRSEVLVMN